MRDKHLYILIVFFILLTSNYSLNAQAMEVPIINSEVVIDGNVNSTEWKNAILLDDFKQLSPNIGSEATENVSVKIMYDQEYLYIGAKISYEDPSQMFATTMERDNDQTNDDYIEILIDTYNDKINSLGFRTNPLSARQDFEVTNNDERFNLSWNTFWYAKSMRDAAGWSTEIRIPFSSLRYKKSDMTTMRIKAIVNYKEKNERILFPLNNITVNQAQYHFSNAQEIVFNNLPSAKTIYTTPYIKSSVIHENVLNEEGTAYESETTILERKNYVENETLDKILSNIGVDVKYRINSNQTLDLTVNTDFAEVEADDRIINISRFPILLPEKRQFFLESADVFNSNHFGHRLFNSRQIGLQNGQEIPIIAGVRLVGSNDKMQYGFLDMQTHKVEDIALSTNMSVARYRQNFGKLGSNIGIINTNRLSKNDYNHLVAIDANLQLTQTTIARITTGATFDKQKGNWKPMYGIDLNTFKANGFGINYRFREYTEDFSPELGFVPRPNTKRLTLNHGWRKTYSNPKHWRLLYTGHYYTQYWRSSNGAKDFLQSNFYFHAIYKNGSRITAFAPIFQEDNLNTPWEISEGIIIPEDKYNMWKMSLLYASGNTRPYQYTVQAEIGEFYGGNQISSTLSFNYSFNKSFKFEFGSSLNHLRFPKEYTQNTSRTVNLNRYFSRIKLNFSTKTILNTYIQYDSKSKKAGINLRFRYNPIEGTDLYLVYNHNANINSDLTPTPPFTDNQVFVIKFSKTFL